MTAFLLIAALGAFRIAAVSDALLLRAVARSDATTEIVRTGIWLASHVTGNETPSEAVEALEPIVSTVGGTVTAEPATPGRNAVVVVRLSIDVAGRRRTAEIRLRDGSVAGVRLLPSYDQP